MDTRVEAKKERAAMDQEELDQQLQEMAYKGDVKRVKQLLELGADVHADKNHALLCSAGEGHLEVVLLLVEYGANVKANDSYALRWSAANGYIKVVVLLVESGADLHANHDEALCLSIRHDQPLIVDYLIEQGANIKRGIETARKTNNRSMLVKLEELQRIRCETRDLLSIVERVNEDSMKLKKHRF